MASHMPAKIVLKSTTSKSLNDRFTEMAKKQVRSPPQVTITGVRSNQFQMSQASMKNRRLAAQMANRPDVQAALGGGNVSSLKSRLGSPNRGRGRGANVKGLLKNRLGVSPNVQVGRNRGGGRGSGFGGGFRQGRGLGSNMRGGVRGRRGGGGVGRSGRGMQGASRGARGGRGARGATRGRGRGRGDKPVSRDKLDQELDKYMSKTKGHLDAELDEYMQHADE